MKLWSVHPDYRDPHGLMALWRDALLAQAVVLGKHSGSSHAAPVERFLRSEDPIGAIGTYLSAIVAEAHARGYRFDPAGVVARSPRARLTVTEGQLGYERALLARRLAKHCPVQLRRLYLTTEPKPHPMFLVIPGPVESWQFADGAADRRPIPPV